MAIPPPVEAALGAFRDLSGQALPAEARAQRLRTEVLLPLARAYADALDGDDAGWRRNPTDLPDHQRATFAAARACLVVLGNGRSALTPELLREVLRLGEGFCELNLQVLDAADPAGRDTLSRLGRAQLHATLCMVGAEATGDVGAAHRARQWFAELGDEAAVQACEHLVRRLGGTVSPEDDPLRTVEMPVLPIALLGAQTRPSPVFAPEDDAPTVDQSAAPDTATLAALPAGPGEPALPVAPHRPGPTTEALATIGPVAPAAPVPGAAGPAPALRPVRTAEQGPRRRPEPQASTLLTAVWPPPRNLRIHLLSTALVLAVVAATGLVAFGAARRAVTHHRAARADAVPTVEPSTPRTPAAPIPNARATTAPTFAVTLAPPTAAAPLIAAGDAPASTAASGSMPVSGAALPETDAELPRVRARRLNTEGFRAYERGDLTTALAQYRAATEADPSLGLPWYNLACVEALEGRVDAALEALETYHRIEPGVDLARRVAADRDFARVRDLPAFRAGFAALLETGRPQVPAGAP